MLPIFHIIGTDIVMKLQIIFINYALKYEMFYVLTTLLDFVPL